MLILKCDERALRSAQEEVARVRKAPVVLENSGVGDSPANGAVEQPVQTLTPWLIEHVADLLSKYTVGADGRTS